MVLNIFLLLIIIILIFKDTLKDRNFLAHIKELELKLMAKGVDEIKDEESPNELGEDVLKDISEVNPSKVINKNSK